MPKLADGTLNFLRQNKKLLSFFWRYAFRAKFHFSKYVSHKVILLRLDLIGDCTMFTSAAKAIREFYQDREMTLVCLSSTKPLFERLGVFDKIISVDFSPHNVDFQKLPPLIRELREENTIFYYSLRFQNALLQIFWPQLSDVTDELPLKQNQATATNNGCEW